MREGGLVGVALRYVEDGSRRESRETRALSEGVGVHADRLRTGTQTWKQNKCGAIILPSRQRRIVSSSSHQCHCVATGPKCLGFLIAVYIMDCHVVLTTSYGHTAVRDIN